MQGAEEILKILEEGHVGGDRGGDEHIWLLNKRKRKEAGKEGQEEKLRRMPSPSCPDLSLGSGGVPSLGDGELARWRWRLSHGRWETSFSNENAVVYFGF